MAFRKVAWGLALLTGLACAPVERARQCRELAARVNPGLAEIRRLSDEEQTPGVLREIGAHYDRIADELGPLEFQSRALAQAVQDYGRHLRALAVQARRAAESIETDQPSLHHAARREVRLREGQLRSAQRRIDENCR